VCNLLAGADHLARWVPGVTSGRVLLVGGGAVSAACRQVVADLTGRPVLVPDTEELVARGAALQAAAVLTGASFDDVATAWDVGRGLVVEPDASVDAAAIRDRYALAAQPSCRDRGNLTRAEGGPGS
jgi:xylulokinase